MLPNKNQCIYNGPKNHMYLPIQIITCVVQDLFKVNIDLKATKMLCKINYDFFSQLGHYTVLV